jgi:VanZ family protein
LNETQDAATFLEGACQRRGFDQSDHFLRPALRLCGLRQGRCARRQLPYLYDGLVPQAAAARHQERPLRGALRTPSSDDGVLKAGKSEGGIGKVEDGRPKAEKGETASSIFHTSPFRLPVSVLPLPPSPLRLFLYYWLPLIAYSALIVFQSHYPTPESVPRLPFFDKLLHAGGYGLLGLLFCRAYRSRWPVASEPSLARLAVLSAALFGLSDEIHQSFVPFRTADAWDVLADALGAALGVGFYFALLSFSDPRPASTRIDKEDAFG